MPVCRENRKRRMKRRERQEARLLRGPFVVTYQFRYDPATNTSLEGFSPGSLTALKPSCKRLPAPWIKAKFGKFIPEPGTESQYATGDVVELN